jgi:hypothetical protein
VGLGWRRHERGRLQVCVSTWRRRIRFYYDRKILCVFMYMYVCVWGSLF